MNLADQIEEIAHRATSDVAAAARELADRQEQLRVEFADFRHDRDAAERLRDDLERDAATTDSATPRLLLPAESADASPHRPRD